MKESTKNTVRTIREALETAFTAGGIASGAIWLVNIVTGKGVSDDAPDLAKAAHQLYHGSKKDPEDEKAMVLIRGELEKKYSGDLAWWDGYIERNMNRYGNTRLGRVAFKKYSHQSRQYIVTMRDLKKADPIKTVETDKAGKKTEKTEPQAATISYDAVVEFLHEVVEKMKVAYGASAAPTTEQKFEDAYQRADDFLRQQDFPVPNFDSTIVDFGESLLAEVESLDSDRIIDNLTRGRDRAKAMFS